MAKPNYTIEIWLNKNEVAKIPQPKLPPEQVRDKAVAKLKHLRECFPGLDWLVRVSYLENGKWEQRPWSGYQIAALLDDQLELELSNKD